MRDVQDTVAMTQANAILLMSYKTGGEPPRTKWVNDVCFTIVTLLGAICCEVFL